MSGNVVPLNAPPQQPVPWQQSTGLWPMSSIVPGCTPGCPPSNLMQCYCDIQNAMQFISAIMIDLINNNPDIAKAMIDAIVNSGAALPLVGVTNGSDAQPGQVGEWLELVADPVNFPAGVVSQQTVTMGIMQPGDWNVEYVIEHELATANPADTSALVYPIPVGFSGGMPSVQGRAGHILISALARASLSVPTLVPLQLNIDNTGGQAGSCRIVFHGRRVR